MTTDYSLKKAINDEYTLVYDEYDKQWELWFEKVLDHNFKTVTSRKTKKTFKHRQNIAFKHQNDDIKIISDIEDFINEVKNG